MYSDSHAKAQPTLTERLFLLFLRLIAVACFWFGLQYWAMLVGFSLDGRGRFDLLSVPWRTAASALAVLFPIASLGLWVNVSWGVVVWVLAASTQMLMYSLWASSFGSNWVIFPMHATVVVVYCLFRFLIWREQDKHGRDVTVDSP
ncbi:DUF6163 family protein [Rhizobium sp. NRK18]|jgi:hypothetical protein|uniref:DUF6163 family protein n=1 Tax=Rhizobium sp. NRK18 TaxID=2964667 RepID=UPI0021C34921|nr:DUF6163 family protein [Rhizobium sp. NRK18]MCQ2004657.1 DUF6163 family protein [Rhizobium sp. NRK18]